MAERPILFSAPMVRALLGGTKTQTRRIFKIKGPMGNLCAITSPEEEILRFDDGTFHYLSTSAMSGPYPCPYGAPGDRLWVRETFAHDGLETLYAADCTDEELAEGRKLSREFPGLSEEYPGGRWRPCIHMPRALSRITLRVTGVRVERLQDISEADAEAEGVEPRAGAGQIARFVAPYRDLWDSINGAGSWDANPWVWVVTFASPQERKDGA